MTLDRMQDPRYQALNREAAIAAEQMATGATLLGEADSTKQGLYSQAFFSLSIGMERAGKLAYVLDHCYENGGSFPTDEQLRREFGHDLRKLIEKADEISQRRRPGNEYEKLPRSAIAEGIIDILTEFASSTRYYNLDLLVNGKSQAKTEPMKLWYERVGKAILDKHYKPKQKAMHRKIAKDFAEFADDAVYVIQSAETGEMIDSFSQLYLYANESVVIRRYSRMYTMQINRFLGTLLSDMGYEAGKYNIDFLPVMADYFAIFRNDDNYFLRRKIWSIYKF